MKGTESLGRFIMGIFSFRYWLRVLFLPACLVLLGICLDLSPAYYWITVGGYFLIFGIYRLIIRLFFYLGRVASRDDTQKKK